MSQITNRFAAAIVIALVATPALGASYQVPTSQRRATTPPFTNRTDGIVYDQESLTPRLVGNGKGFSPLGPTYRELFNYGTQLGLMCESVARTGGFSVVTGANAACNTTCGNAACVAGFEAALSDAGDILPCNDATADVCLCQTTSLDEVMLGCGADWEAPAMGLSRITFASGVKLAHVSLLAQDIGPSMVATGLNIAGDQTNGDGVELIGGLYGATGRPLVPGLDPAFRFCASVETDDESGLAEFWVGFRDTTPPNATWNSYNSYFAVGLPGGNFTVEHEDDGANAASIDTGLDYDEGKVARLCVQVSDTGVATCSINGTVPAACKGVYTFDKGEPVVPIIHLLHGSDVADAVVVSEWEITYPSGAVNQGRVY